jgi:cellobiose dehydrogenase (acceptor)
MRFNSITTFATLAAGASASTDTTTYDYIVVGGGPSGIIAATRLAQTNKTVLLVERGAGPTVGTGANDTLSWNSSLTYTDIPGLSGTLASIGDVFTSDLCDDVAGYAACVLGGGATVNYIVFPHPPDQDFDDAWPTGWAWADVAAAADKVWAVNPGTQLPSRDGQRYDQGMYEVMSTFLSSLGWDSVDQTEQRNNKTQVYSYPNWDVGDQLRAGPVRSYLPIAEEYTGFAYQLQTRARRILRDGTAMTGVEAETCRT